MDIDAQYEDAIRSGNLDLGIQLSLHCAESRGYSVPAYHGTFQTFDEFKEHDIGFHFSKIVFVAQNRLDDKFDDCGMDAEHRVLHVVLSIHNPITVKADLGSWNASDILDAASYRYTKTPFISQEYMYLYEQKAWA